jgi:tripartite ATP-independent transporter DctP family solute receptor
MKTGESIKIGNYLLILVVVQLLSLSSCGKEAAKNSASANDTEKTPVVTLAIGHPSGTGHPYQASAEKMKELLVKANIHLEIYPAAQIAGGAKAVEFVQTGTLDIAIENTMALSNFVPEIDVLNMPFLFNNREEAFRVLDGKIGKQLEAFCETKGFKILAWWENGFRHMSNSKKPITQPGDLKGLIMRVPESEIFITTFETLGALPIAMAFSELFTALQLHTVDGQENPYANFINSKLYEVNKFFSVTNHIFTPEPLIMNLSLFESLPEFQQKALLNAAYEAAVFNRSLTANMDKQQLEQIKAAAGMHVNIVDDMTPFRKAIVPVYEKYRLRFGDLLNAIEQAR